MESMLPNCKSWRDLDGFSGPGRRLRPALRLPGFVVLTLGTLGGWSFQVHAENHFLRGDVDQRGTLELSDAIQIFGFLFLGTEKLSCLDGADANDSGAVDISDGLYILNFLFLGGPSPPLPYPQYGIDPTADSLDCPAAPSCETTVNSIGMRLVYIPPGSFWMGSPESERGRFFSESPVHKVNISRGFFMGATEVTQAQYLAVIGTNPSHCQGLEFGDDLERPVEQVDWFEAVEFTRRLSEAEGRQYRLPTEAEWEFACRAGSTSRFSFGDVLECDDSCGACPAADKYMSWCGNGTTSCSRPVGRKTPNAWCLHDMHGGVKEWCQDGYRKYGAEEVTDPQGDPLAEEKNLRGGYWANPLSLCRSALRGDLGPEHKFEYLGFRVLLEAEPSSP
jgi:formylglycine-generating enzyme required for sulfatase activity